MQTFLLNLWKRETMKPFNLERALAGDRVITRNGKKVIEIYKLETELDFPLVVVIEGERLAVGYRIEGNYYLEKTECDQDLIMAPLKKKYHVRIFRNTHGKIYATEPVDIIFKPSHGNDELIADLEFDVEE